MTEDGSFRYTKTLFIGPPSRGTASRGATNGNAMKVSSSDTRPVAIAGAPLSVDQSGSVVSPVVVPQPTDSSVADLADEVELATSLSLEQPTNKTAAETTEQIPSSADRLLPAKCAARDGLGLRRNPRRGPLPVATFESTPKSAHSLRKLNLAPYTGSTTTSCRQQFRVQ